MTELKRNEKLDIVELLKDLDKYEPRRRGWVWRERAEDQHMGPFEYHEISKPLKQSVPLPPAKFMEDVDPQPMQTITTEIASGRFEDDIRRMRMGAWHGADHLMVIRHMGQSHIDGPDGGYSSGYRRCSYHKKTAESSEKSYRHDRRRSWPSYQLPFIYIWCCRT